MFKVALASIIFCSFMYVWLRIVESRNKRKLEKIRTSLEELFREMHISKKPTPKNNYVKEDNVIQFPKN